MEYLVSFFAWLMDWCHSWCPNYWADIVIFTALTKVLQFPISLWCQANSLKMVSLMPETIRIKINHYGDKDTIGDETAALFKKEHYHPLLSLVPLAFQIVILMAFVKVIYGIGGRLTTPGEAKPLIACVPISDGGLSWLMPIFAGLAAWLLGFTQNIFNPLQHEQSRTEQIVTNGISICISLFLGMFVAAGVGLYWAASNVFSIVVQYFENLCMPPKKYVNYMALRRAQAEIKKFEEGLNTKKKISPEDKKREKNDYKRFFKVANKHLVFYSEGSGYYKYFQSIIEWILEHTNITIHYITNDPKDAIFEKAKCYSKIRPYYIGNVKIIPLFMKMDADMVVMTTPDLNTYQLKRSYVKKDVEYVYVEHGPTSINMCYRKGAFDNFDTVIVTAPFHEEEHRATERVYNLKAKNLVRAGYPYLDVLLSSNSFADTASEVGVKRIMIANSHQKDNVFDSCLDELIASILEKNADCKIVLRPHPQYVRRSPAKMQAIIERYQNNPAIILETDFSQPSTIGSSDVLITDWSSIAYEFAYKTKKPSLFINTPMKVVNPEWQKIGLTPTDISYRDEVGVSLNLNEISRAGEVVKDMLINADKFAKKIDKLMEGYYHLGTSGEAVGKYILDSLIARKKGTKK